MKFIKTGLPKTILVLAGVVGVLGTLGACSTYDDGYDGYSSVSVGVASGPYYSDRYYHRGYRGGYWRDRDGDGIPNRYDAYPYNPYRP